MDNNKNRKKESMRIAPVLPQTTFTGNNDINRRTFLKKVGLGAAGVAAGAVIAPKALAQEQPKPVVFAREAFPLVDYYAGPQTLTLRVANRQGNTNSFDTIWASLMDNHTQKTTDGKVVTLFDVPDKDVQRVVCYTFDGDRLVNTSNKNVFDFVKKFVSSTWNKSDISIVKTLR